jgi:hypothetical protein
LKKKIIGLILQKLSVKPYMSYFKRREITNNRFKDYLPKQTVKIILKHKNCNFISDKKMRKLNQRRKI